MYIKELLLELYPAYTGGMKINTFLYRLDVLKQLCLILLNIYGHLTNPEYPV